MLGTKLRSFVPAANTHSHPAAPFSFSIVAWWQSFLGWRSLSVLPVMVNSGFAIRKLCPWLAIFSYSIFCKIYIQTKELSKTNICVWYEVLCSLFGVQLPSLFNTLVNTFSWIALTLWYWIYSMGVSYAIQVFVSSYILVSKLLWL